jgi:hypothetical protein
VGNRIAGRQSASLAGNWHRWHPGKPLSRHFTGSLQHMDLNKNAAQQLLYKAALVLVIGAFR